MYGCQTQHKPPSSTNRLGFRVSGRGFTKHKPCLPTNRLPARPNKHPHPNSQTPPLPYENRHTTPSNRQIQALGPSDPTNRSKLVYARRCCTCPTTCETREATPTATVRRCLCHAPYHTMTVCLVSGLSSSVLLCYALVSCRVLSVPGWWEPGGLRMNSVCMCMHSSLCGTRGAASSSGLENLFLSSLSLFLLFLSLYLSLCLSLMLLPVWLSLPPL